MDPERLHPWPVQCHHPVTVVQTESGHERSSTEVIVGWDRLGRLPGGGQMLCSGGNLTADGDPAAFSRQARGQQDELSDFL